MPTRHLGSLAVPAIGFGVMVLSPGIYGDATDVEADRALGAAIDAGATFLDTSDAYGRGHNEEVIARWLRTHDRAGVQIGTKFGMWVPDGAPRHELRVPWSDAPALMNASGPLVRTYLERSLRHLGTDHVDLYMPHFPDPEVPIEETVGAIAELVDAGMVGHVGLSNVTAEHVRRAASVRPVAAVQVEWSMWKPIDAELLATCDELGTGVVAYSPLGRGFLTGELAPVDERDWRVRVPRFAADRLDANNDRFAPVRAVAADLGITPAQLALAWLLHQRAAVVPIPGSRRPDRIRENTAAAGVVLAADDLARVDAALAAFQPDGPMYQGAP